MAINFPEGTQNYPGHVFHTVYAQSNAVQSFSIGNGFQELSNYQLNNIDVRNTTDIVFLQCRIFNDISDTGDEYGYGWQYKNSGGGWSVIDQNQTLGDTHYGRQGHVHSTHDSNFNHGQPTDHWGIVWKPGSISGVIPGQVDVRPIIMGHGSTGCNLRINAFDDGYSGSNSEWNRRSSSYAMATVYITEGVN
tara:strand:+ start:1548 stop:2123 length:576 start_codon:yes stop_codon:yes gene_type:complete